jgi:hypothetical protein
MAVITTDMSKRLHMQRRRSSPVPFPGVGTRAALRGARGGLLTSSPHQGSATSTSVSRLDRDLGSFNLFAPAHTSTRTSVVSVASPEDYLPGQAPPGQTITETSDDVALAEQEDTPNVSEPVEAKQGPASPSGPAAPACSVTGRFTRIPSGALTARMSGNRLHRAFRMRARFNAPRGCSCSCGEYRQYVKGYFRADGVDVSHTLGPGRTLSRTTFQEDGDLSLGTAYGYRSSLGTGSRFLSSQATGCRFQGEDDPGLANTDSGVALEMNLEFQGDLIDTCNGNAVIATSTWSVAGTGTTP